MLNLKLKSKAEGNMIIYAVALGMLIFTLGQGILRLQGAEVRFAGQLYQSERAHYGAESGVEIALLENKKAPRNHVEEEEINLNDEENENGISSTIWINNRVKEFGFTLGAEQAKQLTLEYDTNDELDGFDPQRLNTLTISSASESGGTFEVNKCLGSPSNQIVQEVVGGTMNLDFSGNIGGLARCVVQIKNLSPQSGGDPSIGAINFTFSGQDMSPHNTRITSIGRAGTREKHLTFTLERNKSLLNINFFQQ